MLRIRSMGGYGELSLWRDGCGREMFAWLWDMNDL